MATTAAADGSCPVKFRYQRDGVTRREKRTRLMLAALLLVTCGVAVAAMAVENWAKVTWTWKESYWGKFDSTKRTYGLWKGKEPDIPGYVCYSGQSGCDKDDFPGTETVRDLNRTAAIMGLVSTFIAAIYYVSICFISLFAELILGTLLLVVGAVAWAAFDEWVKHFENNSMLKNFVGGNTHLDVDVDPCNAGCKLQATCAGLYTVLGIAMIFIAVRSIATSSTWFSKFSFEWPVTRKGNAESSETKATTTTTTTPFLDERGGAVSRKRLTLGALLLVTFGVAVAAAAVRKWATVEYEWTDIERAYEYRDKETTVTYGPWKHKQLDEGAQKFPGDNSVQDVNRAATFMGCVSTFLSGVYYVSSGLCFISLLTELILGSLLLVIGVVSWAGFGAWVDHFEDESGLKTAIDGFFVKVHVKEACADGCRLQAVCSALYTVLGIATIYIVVSEFRSNCSCCNAETAEAPQPRGGCCACDCCACNCCCCVNDDGEKKKPSSVESGTQVEIVVHEQPESSAEESKG